MSQLFPTMTPDVMCLLIRAARRRRNERRGAWRNAINNFGIRPHAGGSGASKAGYSSRTGTAGENPAFPTNFRPANPAKAQDILANLTCANAAPKESQGV